MSDTERLPVADTTDAQLSKAMHAKLLFAFDARNTAGVPKSLASSLGSGRQLVCHAGVFDESGSASVAWLMGPTARITELPRLVDAIAAVGGPSVFFPLLRMSLGTAREEAGRGMSPPKLARADSADDINIGDAVQDIERIPLLCELPLDPPCFALVCACSYCLYGGASADVLCVFISCPPCFQFVFQ